MTSQVFKSLSNNHLERLCISCLAVIAEVLGRRLFPNYDINYLVYGARFYAERNAPWMNVWPGIDIIHGVLGKMLGSPEISILCVGLAVNIAGALLVDQIYRSLKISNLYRYSAVAATVLLFKPTLGGWTADHISFLVGISPAGFFILNKFRLSNLIYFFIGGSLALGVLLKLNSFLTAYTASVFFILACSLLVLIRDKTDDGLPVSVKKIVVYGSLGIVFIASIIHALVDFKLALYPLTIGTYAIASQSTSSGQFGLDRIARIPLQIDILDAIRFVRLGVLMYTPLVMMFWLCIARSSKKLLDSDDVFTIKRHLAAFFLLLVSAITAYSLGRGVSHRLFFLPAGILLSIYDLSLLRRYENMLPWMFVVYVSLIYGSLGVAQKSLEWGRFYDLRRIVGQGNLISPKICLRASPNASDGNSGGIDKSLGVLVFTPTSTDKSNNGKCWSKSEVANGFGGFMHTEEIANSLGITFLNHQALAGDYFEKWDWRKTLPEVRAMWSRDNAEWINKERIKYFIERVNIIPEEFEVPGYKENIIPRQLQLELLVSKTGATRIGQLGRFSLWKTRWADEEPNFDSSRKHKSRSI